MSLSSPSSVVSSSDDDDESAAASAPLTQPTEVVAAAAATAKRQAFPLLPENNRYVNPKYLEQGSPKKVRKRQREMCFAA
jgi:hypothetical protein